MLTWVTVQLQIWCVYVRILQHHIAQEDVLELVNAFSCDVCKAQQAPEAVRENAPPGI